MLVSSWTLAGLFTAALMAAPPQGSAPIERAQSLLEQAQGMEPTKQREAGRKSIRDALALLDKSEGATANADVMSLRWRLATEAYRFGAIVLERETWRGVCAYFEQLPTKSADDATYYRAARQNLARALGRTGFEKHAHRLMHEVLKECSDAFGPDHAETQTARWDLATALLGIGPVAEARQIWQGFLDGMRDVPDHDARKQQVFDHLAGALWSLGEYEGALSLRQRRVAALEAAKAPIDKEYLQARINVAGGTRELRGPQDSLPLVEQVLALAAEHLDPGDEAILRWHANQLALDLRRLGDTDQAIERLRAAMRQFEKHHADCEGHESYQQAGRQLGITYGKSGDFASALTWQEQELRLRRQSLPPEDAAVLEAMTQLAYQKERCGDYAGARPLFEEVLRTRLEILTPEAPVVQDTRIDLACCLDDLGELGPARRLCEDAISALQAANVSPVHADLLRAKNALAWILTKQGEGARAVAILRDVVARTREAWAHSPILYDYLDSLALAEWQAGDLDGAVATWREAMAGLFAVPRSDLFECKRNYALALAAAGAGADLQDVLKQLSNQVQQWLSNLLPLSSREITASGEQVRHVLDVSLSLGKEQAVPDARLFELFESLRAASIPLGNIEELRGGGDFAALLRELRAARQQLNDLIADLQQDTASPNLQRKIEAAAARRDSAEKDLRAARSRAGFDPRRITAADVAGALHRGEAAVGFHRYEHWTLAAKPPHLPEVADHIVAFVVREDGAVTRCDLGPAAAIEELVQAWRAAVGKPLPRGRPGDSGSKPDVLAIGRRLRELLLDPVLIKARKPNAADGKLKLYVCLDDVLHLVPLDALPLAGTEVVGDRHQLLLLSSFAQLVAPRKQALVGGSLVAFGGIDFAAEIKAEPAAGVATPPVQGAMRAEFYPLRQTRLEVEDLEQMFKKFARGQMKIEVRSAAAATKKALHELAPQARYLHLATHGYFAPDSVRSMLDGQDAGSSTLSETIQGLAPMTLCGLAFAGAQQGRDASGSVPGILTAEELAGIDLHRCQLAVLSACETNVGIRRAGQGIRSLQAALQAAGAQQAVTSLWRVDDAVTREFMLSFYGNLWNTTRKQSVAEALWNAKQALRRRADIGIRDWAGWVLTGLER